MVSTEAKSKGIVNKSEYDGVGRMLDVVESMFARLEADTKTAEATAQKFYHTLRTESKVDKAAKP